MMTKQEYFELLDKYEKGLATREEERLLYAYYNLFDVRKDGLQDLTELQRVGLSRDIKESIDRRVRSINGRGAPPKLWAKVTRMAATWKVAAAVAAITLGVWLYYTSSMNGRHSDEGWNPGSVKYANDIAPGKNTATLTFDDGEVVDLNDKELEISSATVEPLKEGSEVASEKTQFLARRIAKSKTVVLSTPRGGTYQVTLPDGSRAWLNADSKISFPSQFSGQERKVLLVSGEAYFEVAKAYVGLSPTKRLRKPFIVESKGQQVEVLGTHFNINSYADEGSVKTTLLEGSVEVSSPDVKSGLRYRLKPNQQAILKGEALKIKEVDPAEAVAWKNGEFLFDDEPLESIMRKLARWYDVEVVYQDVDKGKLFGGGVSRYDHISSVLNKLEKTGGIHFKIEGRRVYVTP